VTGLEHARLGASGIEVSRVALGSWQTFERMDRAAGLAVMRAAREAGIDFLDDARYDDQTGKAPIPTGYSEVVFGELFRAACWPRDEVVVANKLWWEFWPRQSAAAELDASLDRMGFDHLDLVYAERPPAGLEVREVVAELGELMNVGKIRAWGLLNWPADLLAHAGREAAVQGVPAPAAVQLPYALVRRSPVEDPDVAEALAATGASVVASAVLAGGALTGKYADPSAAGRVAERRDDPGLAPAFGAAARLSALAERLATTPAALAIAFALANPAVASVLFGATSPGQIAENAAALDLLDRLRDDELEALRAIGA
jgi:aryl-alcohol dehydrogenase-like predicted oxidoreductase